VIESEFTSIPSKAFNRYSSIKIISFHNYNKRQFLEKINSNVFHRLTDLREIDFRNNKISKIIHLRLDLRQNQNHTLRIHLENNYLNINSFKPNSLIGGNGRRVILYLGAYNQCNPELKSLNEKVFKPFLLENKRNVMNCMAVP